MKKIIIWCLLGTFPSLMLGDELTALRIESLILAQHPQLKQYDGLFAQFDAQVEQAGLWQNPVISIEAENLGGDYDGVHDGEYTVAISQAIPRKKQRELTQSGIRAEQGLTRLDRATTQSELRLWIHQQLIATAGLQAKITVAEQQLKLTRAQAEEVARLHQRGAQSTRDTLLAKSDQLEAEQQLAGLKQVLEKSFRLLSLLCGEPVESINYPLADRSASLPSESVVSPAHPKLQQAQAQMAAQENQIAIAKESRKPEFVVTAGVRSDQLDHDQSMLIALEFPLSVWDRGGAAVRAERAKHQQLSVQAEQAQLELTIQLRTVESEWAQAKSQLEHLAQLQTARESLVTETQEGFRQGRYSLSLLQEEQHQLLALENERIEQREALSLARLNLTFLTQSQGAF